MMAELIAETEIDLLKVRAQTLREIREEFTSWSGKYPTNKELDFKDRLMDLERSVAQEVKRIQRQTKREANEFRSKL